MIKPLLRGVATYVPGLKRFASRHTGGTDSARYCYSVWLRHLVSLGKAGVPTNPHTIAELGPGDSLGTGIAAILSGAEHYYALDVKPYFENRTNLVIFEELLDLFHRREPIPDAEEFPGVWPQLASYDFPRAILTEERLAESLAPTRTYALRSDLAQLANHQQGRHFSYYAPWQSGEVLRPASVDLVFSQAVMEHVVDIRGTYAALARWLRPGGCMSHSIDFRSHQTAAEWNGHWGYSDFIWKIILGTRAFLINREAHSNHLQSMRNCGFEILLDNRCHESPGLSRERLASRFRALSDEDLATSGTFVISRKVGTDGP